MLSFDNIFLETDIAQGMFPKGKRTEAIHNFTMDVDPGFKYIKILEVLFNGARWKKRLYFKSQSQTRKTKVKI